MIRHRQLFRTSVALRLVAAALSLALVGTALSIAAPAELLAAADAATWTVDTTTRTEADMRARWEQLKPTYTGAAYAVAPSLTSPYAPGDATVGFRTDGLKMLNFGRYLAGLPSDVTLDAARNTSGQYGAVLLTTYPTLTHEPPKPADMDSTFYSIGLAATKSSNIGSGYSDAATFEKNCLADSSATNLPMVGHRRWILNPRMKVTGIGFAGSRITTYVFDSSRTDTVSYRHIAWPSAGIFPAEFMTPQTPWSITLNPDLYDWDASGYSVTLKRVSDGRTWTFTAADTNTAGEYFNADFGGFGVGNAFIFRPDPASIAYAPGDQFDVTFSGGIYAQGTRTPVTVTYRTSFGALTGASTTWAAPLEFGAEPEPRPQPQPGEPVAIEQNDPGVTWCRFVPAASAVYSGGGYVYGRWTGTQLEARFSGSTVRWYGPTQPSYGMADVYIDGVWQATVDCYALAASATLESLLWEATDLADGPHTIALRLTGAKNAASSGNVVVVDRFESVSDAAVELGTRLDETDGTFAGGWVSARNTTYHEAGYAYSYWAGASHRVTFSGTRIAWVGPKTTGYGRAAIYLDGVYRGTVSQYSAVAGWRYRIWESPALACGTHTLEIRVLGTKDAASTGTIIVLDAFDVTP
jgi:hypothetical protein